MWGQSLTQMNRTTFNSCQPCVSPTTLCSALLAIPQASNKELPRSPGLDLPRDFVDNGPSSTNVKQKEHHYISQEPPASLVVSWRTVMNFRNWNLRKALHLVWKAYPGTQVTSRTKQLHENDTVLQLHLNCMRSWWHGVLQWPSSSRAGTTQQSNLQVARTNKIHRPRTSSQLSPTHRYHHLPLKWTTFLVFKSASVQVGAPPPTTHTPAV